MELTYSRRVFEAKDEAAARRIILTPEYGQGTDERWERETPYLVELMGQYLQPREGQVILDYGCGIGRLAKGLIERFKCRVIGVDMSESMRSLAPKYVGSQLFAAISPYMLHTLARKGLRVDGAFSVWALQHCAAPIEDLNVLRAAMSPNAPFFVVNTNYRALPTLEGRWMDDGIDVRGLIAERFSQTATGSLDTSVVQPQTSENSFWAAYATPG